MSNLKTSQEAAASSLTGSEIVRIVQGGVNKQTSLQSIADLSGAGNETGVAAKLIAIRSALRRVLNAQRKENAKAVALAYPIYQSAKQTNTDGSFTAWNPDGAATYGAMWTRDVSMAIENWPEYFSAAEVGAIAEYILSKSNMTSKEVPDHIAADGTVYWTPGNSNNWGARAPIDGQLYLVQTFWLNYLMSGSTALYSAHRVNLKALIESGITYDGTTKGVTIPSSGNYVGFGFYDTVQLDGVNSFCTILAYRAYAMLAEMELALGNTAEAERLYERAQDMRSAIKAILTVRDGSGSEILTPFYSRKLAYLPASTGNASGQIDLWATAFAVFNGILDAADERAACAFLLYATNSTPDNVVSGGLRHVYKPSDYSSGAHCFPSYHSGSEPTFGTYQNGGYWTTATPWLVHALSLLDITTAQSAYTAMVAANTSDGANAPYEWWNAARNTFGVAKYLASAAPMFCQGAMPPVPPASASESYDMLGLLNAEVSITGTTTLSSTAFGKWHVCSGTSANYTVTLPTATGNAGKVIGIRMGTGTALTRLVTLSGNGGQTIDGATGRVMWAYESAVLMSDGTEWHKIAGKTIPMSCTMKRTSAQSLSTGWSAINCTSVVTDGTAILAAPMADTTNGRVSILRQGRYTASGFCSISGLSSGIEFNAGVAANSNSPGDNPNAFTTCPTPSSGSAQASGTGTFVCSAGDYITTIANTASAGNTRAVSTVYPTLSVIECPTW